MCGINGIVGIENPEKGKILFDKNEQQNGASWSR
jgi:hypothetical protein